MNLPEGSAGKVVLHAVVAGLTAKLGGDTFAAGSMAGAINEIMNGAISSYEKAHNKGLTPAEHQWISAAVGAIVNSATGSTIQTGMADAVYATKLNFLWEYIESFRKSLEDVDVSGLPEGCCRIVTYGATGSIEGVDVGVQDSAIIFNTEDQDVFSSFGVTGGKSKLPFSISTEVAVGWLEDPEGNVVTDSETIKKLMKGWTVNVAGSISAGISVSTNFNGYKFYTKLLNPNIGFSFGGSNTIYLGKKSDVVKGDF